jgi:hypothetical protein
MRQQPCTSRFTNIHHLGMDIDWNAEVVDQIESHWQHQLRPRLDGLTDHECIDRAGSRQSWTPVTDMNPSSAMTPPRHPRPFSVADIAGQASLITSMVHGPSAFLNCIINCHTQRPVPQCQLQGSIARTGPRKRSSAEAHKPRRRATFRPVEPR